MASEQAELQGEFFVEPHEDYRKFSVRARSVYEAMNAAKLPELMSEHPRKPGLYLTNRTATASPSFMTFDVYCHYEKRQ